MPLIQYDDTIRKFLINAGNFSYAFGVNKDGLLTNLHWGGPVCRIEDLPSPYEVTCHRHGKEHIVALTRQEYPSRGGEFFNEPALTADLPCGARGFVLKYKEHNITESADTAELTVNTVADLYPLEVRLHYLVRKDSGILERWSEIINKGNETVTLRSAMSADFNLPRRDSNYRLSSLCGRWGKEGIIERQEICQDQIILQSRTGLSSSLSTPFFAIDDGNATEDSGRVWFGALHWSGNWKIAVERNAYEQVSICGGINDFDFSWPLTPQEIFTTPVFSAGISESGFGGMSRMMHEYQCKYILPPGPLSRPMPVLFNSWAAMNIHVNEERIITTAEKAAKLGIELFVIDDGWQTALGDWTPDPKKFPRGLKPVVDKVKSLGMDFGLWVEIESFELKSKLYQEHPEWAMAYPGCESPKHHRQDVDRASFMLNLACDEAAEYMYQSLRRLFQETGIKYLKLDMNYYFASPGLHGVPQEKQQTMWVKYVQNLHGIFARLIEEFPDAIFENCASGGGRADLGMSRYFSRINRSDNQDTLDILKMHEGFTWIHPSRLAGGACHISDGFQYVNHRKTPLRYQAFTGMMGSLAIGKNLYECPQQELDEIKEYIELHKRVRHITHFGEMYRLASHYNHPFSIVEFVSRDKKEALVFVLGHSIQFADKVPAFQLKGLNPDDVYEFEYFGNQPEGGYSASIEEYLSVSGRGLMELGLRVELFGDFDARLMYLKAK